MNGKKARALRKLFKERGLDVMGEAQYKQRSHRRLKYVTNETTGKPEAKVVSRLEIQNHTKLPYRRAKKLYKQGEIQL